MVIGLFLAGLLLFAVVGIARKTTGATVASAMQNNISGAVGRPVMPQAQPVALPVVQVVVVVTATPTRPTRNWLDIAVDVTGAPWVWGDSAWIACGRIAADLTYSIDQSEPSWSAWYWLRPEQRQQVYNVCLEVTR
jgi:hypothetical protein